MQLAVVPCQQVYIVQTHIHVCTMHSYSDVLKSISQSLCVALHSCVACEPSNSHNTTQRVDCLDGAKYDTINTHAHTKMQRKVRTFYHYDVIGVKVGIKYTETLLT